MDVAHAILLSGNVDFSRLTADYLSVKFELNCLALSSYAIYTLLSISLKIHCSENTSNSDMDLIYLIDSLNRRQLSDMSFMPA